MKLTDLPIDYWQAIIFDFDGVIVESGDIKTEAFAELYRQYGEPIMQAAVAYHRANGGMSRYLKFRYFQQQLLKKPPLTKEEERRLDQQFSSLVMQAVIKSQAVAGATALIARASRIMPLFIASGTPENELRSIVEQRGLTPFFTAVRGAPALKQTIIAEIIATHKLDAQRVLMIGDAAIDYESARLNNTSFLGRVRPQDVNPFPETVEIIPDLCPLAN